MKNLIDFKKERHNGYTCKCYGYYVKKQYCGALKVMEYDQATNYVTVYLQKTPKELKIDLICYQLAQGEIDRG